MDNRSTETHGRRLTLADFPPAEVEQFLRSRGQTLESVQELERQYVIAEHAGDEGAKKKLNAKLQPIYQGLVGLHT